MIVKVSGSADIPTGSQMIILQNIELKDGDNGQYFNWRFVIAEGPLAGVSTTGFSTNIISSLSKAGKWCQALGVPLPSVGQSFDLASAFNKKAVGQLERTVTNTGPRTKVLDLLPEGTPFTPPIIPADCIPGNEAQAAAPGAQVPVTPQVPITPPPVAQAPATPVPTVVPPSVQVPAPVVTPQPQVQVPVTPQPQVQVPVPVTPQVQVQIPITPQPAVTTPVAPQPQVQVPIDQGIPPVQGDPKL